MGSTCTRVDGVERRRSNIARRFRRGRVREGGAEIVRRLCYPRAPGVTGCRPALLVMKATVMKTLPLPPGPKGHFLRGNLPEFRRGRLDFLSRCARDYGPFVALRFGPRRVLLVSDADA